MKAHELMTRNVTTVTPDTSVRAAVELIMKNQFSVLPVVDANEKLVGILSEGDLISEALDSLMQRRDWWMNALAEGDQMSPAYLDYVKKSEIPVKHIMKTSVITAGEETAIDDIAKLLTKNHIKRVPIVRDGKVVGIISRSDLMQLVIRKLMPA